MKRRKFVKICASTVVGVSANPELLAEGPREIHAYQRVALVGAKGREPVSAASIEVGEAYLFNYPYVTTPCFLIDLGYPVTNTENLRTRSGDPYSWPGGTGPKQSVVAFSAICAHKMSHPARSVSFINYRHENTSFRDLNDEVVESEGVIYCCSEKSVYDPSRGARVLGGPAPEPLAAILLDYDQTEDTFYATATVGGEMFNRYFASFNQRLMLDHERTDIQKASSGDAELVRLSDFCKNQVLC